MGDAIAIRIKDIAVTSSATSSGNDAVMEGRFDAIRTAHRCVPAAGGKRREAAGADRRDRRALHSLRGGREAVDVANGSRSRSTTSGAGPHGRRPGRGARARRGPRRREPGRLVPSPVLTFAPHGIVGLVTRMRPFLGQLGTSPSATIPDSHNAGDFGAFLVGAPHAFAMDAAALSQHKTDGHLDIDAVRGRDPRLPGEAARAGVCTWVTCTRCRATARSPATPPTWPAR